MEENLAQKAINFTLECNWNEAIKTNLLILKKDTEDIDALNRLAHAYFEKGEINKAKTTSRKVLKISPSNNIAIKALEKYKLGKTSETKNRNIDVSVFIEEPGKTKLTNLINIGSSKTCSCLNAGDEVILRPHSHRVTVTTMAGSYIGKLTDDLSARLRKLIKAKNVYRVFIKSANKKEIAILIKEVERGHEYKNTPSFPREILESDGETFSESDY